MKSTTFEQTTDKIWCPFKEFKTIEDIAVSQSVSQKVSEFFRYFQKFLERFRNFQKVIKSFRKLQKVLEGFRIIAATFG